MSTINKTQVALTVAPVISAALLGASFQLIFYPQVLIGGGLFLSGTLMKLASAWVGILLMIVGVFLLAVLAFVLNSRLAKGLPHALVTIISRIAPKFLLAIRKIPVWMIIIAIFGIPALGQLNASFAMVRMLIFVGAESSPLAISGFSVASLIITFLVQVLGVFSSAWRKPGKISFLLQSFWILRTILTGAFRNSEEGSKPIWPFLSTILVGWGSIILSSLPDRAVLDASQAAMRAAMVSGAAAGAVTAGVAVKRARDIKAHSPIENSSSETETLMEAIDNIPVNSEEDKRYNEDFLKALNWLTNSAEKVASRVKEKAEPSMNKIFTEINKKLYDERSNPRTPVSTDPVDNLDEEPIVTEPVEIEPLPESQAAPNQEPLALTMLLQLNPPIGVAVIIAILRAIPTCIVFLLAEFIAIFQFLTKRGKLNAIVFPVILVPFALAEIFALVRQVGFKKGLSSIYRLSMNTDTDGLSILLWQSPKLLATWTQFKQADNRMGAMGGNLMSVLLYPKTIFFPSEEDIANAPEVNPFVFAKLLSSIIIDIIGVSTFAVPGLGETLDLLWAPVSGFLIQRMYGSPGFAFMGFAEEVLPFTDILPTATIAWFWLYGVYLPVWIIRVIRLSKLMQASKGKKKEPRLVD